MTDVMGQERTSFVVGGFGALHLQTTFGYARDQGVSDAVMIEEIHVSEK